VLSFVDVCMFEPKGARERREIVSAGVDRMAYQAPAFLDLSQSEQRGSVGRVFFSTGDFRHRLALHE
jgi:hypothetical protein